MVETRKFMRDEILATAGDWMLLKGTGDKEVQFATKVPGLDLADCPAALLIARAEGKVSQMSRDLLGELADAGNHVIALCIIEDYFAKCREGG